MNLSIHTALVNQVDIIDEDGEVQSYINLLILALGLTYEGNENIRFVQPANDVPTLPIQDNDRYFYYDLQDAAYK